MSKPARSRPGSCLGPGSRPPAAACRRGPRGAGRRPRGGDPAAGGSAEGSAGAPLAGGHRHRCPGRLQPAARRGTRGRPAPHRPGPGPLPGRAARITGRTTRPRLSRCPARPALHSAHRQPSPPAAITARPPTHHTQRPGAKPPHPSLAARVTLTVPLFTYLGSGTEPGHVAGFGPIDPALARELTVRAAAHPASRFCLTITGPAGRPSATAALPAVHPILLAVHPAR